MSESSSPFPSVNGTMGCLFLSTVFTSALWGVGNVQIYFYCESPHYKTDKLWLKFYISIAWVLDTAHQALLLDGTYIYLVKDIGDVVALTGLDRPLLNTPILLGLIDFQVQLLFVYRAWMLSDKNNLLAAFLLVLITGQLAVVIVYFAETYHNISFILSVSFLTIVKSLSAVTVFADTTLAFVLAYLLHKRKSGFTRTDSLVNKLMTYTISTGMITGAVALASLFAALFKPHDYIYVLCWELLPKLYFNCMLTSLNLRRSLSNSASGTIDAESSMFTSRSKISKNLNKDVGITFRRPNMLTGISTVSAYPSRGRTTGNELRSIEVGNDAPVYHPDIIGASSSIRGSQTDLEVKQAVAL